MVFPKRHDHLVQCTKMAQLELLRLLSDLSGIFHLELRLSPIRSADVSLNSSSRPEGLLAMHRLSNQVP